MKKASRLILSLMAIFAISMPAYSSDVAFASWAHIDNDLLRDPEIRAVLGTGITPENIHMFNPTIIYIGLSADDSIDFSQSNEPLAKDEVRNIKIESMTELDFSNRRLASIAGIAFFQQLRNLDLSGNLFEVLPTDLASLKIGKLNISGNPYKTVPSEMFKIMSKENCFLSENRDLRIAYQNTALLMFLEHNGCQVIR